MPSLTIPLSAAPTGDGSSNGNPPGSPVADAVSDALAVPDALRQALGLDLGALQGELADVAEQALAARRDGVGLAAAVADPTYPALGRFHTDLRDALLVEIPNEIRGFVESATRPEGGSGAEAFGSALAEIAQENPREPTSTAAATDAEPAHALAEFLVFQAVRLRLLVQAWQTEDYERLGGDERDIDVIAGREVETLLAEPALADGEVRPLMLLVAAASVSLAADAQERVHEMRRVGDDVREELAMQARLRKALRELRLPESVLLGNALSGLLGEQRQELPDLQRDRPVALDGLSRQAMDQRVSRGRKALTRSHEDWPRRKRPALFDLVSDDEGEARSDDED